MVFILINLVGYGDLTPKTLFGRLTGVFFSILGIFIMSLFIVALVNITILDPVEYHVYKKIIKADIKSQSDKLKGSSSFIKYKLSKLNKKSNLSRVINARNNYTFLREKYLIKLQRLYNPKSNLVTLCQNMQDILSDHYAVEKIELSKKCNSLIKSFQPLSDNTEKQVRLFKTCKRNTFSLINLSLMMMSLGNSFEVPCTNNYLFSY